MFEPIFTVIMTTLIFPQSIGEQINVIGLLAKTNRRFVCAEFYGRLPLTASRDFPSTWEKFELHINRDQTVSFKSLANKRFVTISKNGNGQLIAKSERIFTPEKFYMLNNSDKTISLKAVVNGKFICLIQTYGRKVINEISTKCNEETSIEKFYLRYF